MKIGVVGSRNFTDQNLMHEVLVDDWMLGGMTHLVSGGAEGADSMAVGIVTARGYDIDADVTEYLPDRERYGWPAAAFERNSLIVDASDVLLAFFGPGEPPSVNKSGTMDSVRKAIAKRIPVHLYFQAD